MREHQEISLSLFLLKSFQILSETNPSMTMMCLDLIRSKGLEKINLDDLVEEMLPRGRALVPTNVKEDLLARIKSYLEKDEDYKRLTGY